MKIEHPADFGTIINEITRRLDALERTPPPALSLVARLQSTVAAQPYINTWTDVPGTTTSTFSVSRPASVLVIPTAIFYTSGGTANYGYVRCAIKDDGGNLIYFSPQMIHTNPSAISDGSHPFSLTLSAGTYTARYQYLVDTGATTTLTINSFEIDVFLMGG